MLSDRIGYPASGAVAVLSLIVSGLVQPPPARANPATVDYRCQPGFKGGDRISIDFNPGGKSITLQTPDGRPTRLPIQLSGSGFRYGDKSIEVMGKGQTTITLTVTGEPSRQCMTGR